MDESEGSWLSDLEMEECNLLQECHLNLLDFDDDEEFLVDDIVASALHGDNLQQPLSLESYTSYSQTQTLTLTLTDHFSPNLSPSSSPPSPTSQNMSFDNSNSSPANNNHFYGLVSTLSPKPQTRKRSSDNLNSETETPKPQGRDKSPSHAPDHILAERKRREKLSQSLIALAALIPGLKRMDKASVLGNAIKYVKELQERLKLLEEQNNNRDVESVVMINKPQTPNDDAGFYYGSGRERLPRVEAKVSEKDLLIRIHCQKRKGLLLKILIEIQNLHLFVVSSNVLPFGDSILDITIVAQMGPGYNLTLNDLVKNVRVATLKLMP